MLQTILEYEYFVFFNKMSIEYNQEIKEEMWDYHLMNKFKS